MSNQIEAIPEDKGEGPPGIGSKLCDITHLTTDYGRLQLCQLILSFATFLGAIISMGTDKNLSETQIVGLIVVFGISFLVDLIWLALLYFNIDSSFEYLQDRKYIVERVKVIMPFTIGLIQMFSLIVATTRGRFNMNIVMLFGYCSALAHILILKWIYQLLQIDSDEDDDDEDESRRSSPTYMRSADPLPDIFVEDAFDSASLQPTFSVTVNKASGSSSKRSTPHASPRSSFSSTNHGFESVPQEPN